MCRIKMPNPMQIPKDPENTWMEIFELIEETLAWDDTHGYLGNERIDSYYRGYVNALKDIKEIIET